jgi:hypothetical protein
VEEFGRKESFKKESSSSEENPNFFFKNFQKCCKNTSKHTNRRCVFVVRKNVALMVVAAVALCAGRNFYISKIEFFSCT